MRARQSVLSARLSPKPRPNKVRYILTISIPDISLDARIKALASRYGLTQGQVVVRAVQELEAALEKDPSILAPKDSVI